MPVHIALLRGINVGGRKLVAMADLRTLVESLGFTDVRSLLQSGNLVFRGARPTGAALEGLLEQETQKRLGADVHYLVRTSKEWEKIIAANPFPDEAASDPSRLVLLTLKKAPTAKDIAALQAAIRGPEIVRGEGRELYAYYPAGQGESKLTNALIEQKLGTRATARNWNTVLKLGALAGEK